MTADEMFRYSEILDYHNVDSAQADAAAEHGAAVLGLV